jgi:hypothetical protein
MGLTWRQLIGSTDRFAIEFSLIADPDEGRSASPETSSSWGEFKIFVEGRNLCESKDSAGTTLNGVQWYLLPLLRFLVYNWDALLHEQRLPLQVRQNAELAAASLMARTRTPSQSQGLDAFTAWHDLWWTYYSRHAIASARDGGLFPNVWVRRFGNDVEISWDNDANPAEPPIRFLERKGASTVPAAEFSEIAGSIMVAILDELLRREPVVREFAALRAEVTAIMVPNDNRRWLRHALLLGLRRDFDDAVQFAQALARRTMWLRPYAASGPFSPATLPALVFSSYSPDISEADAIVILSAFEDARGSVSSALEELHEEAPCPFTESWKSGYELALRCRAKLGLGDDPVPLVDLIRSLQIESRAVSLSDPSIRAVSFVAPDDGIHATVLVNQSSPWNDKSQSKAATLAHELCHLMFDRRLGKVLGISSGPWAEPRFEQRANAFAAMFLLPESGVSEKFKGATGRLRDKVHQVADHFGASFIATLQHLTNLGLVEPFHRDSLLNEMELDL